MNTDLQLIATKEFNGITLNCYQEKVQQDNSDFWATREQIGMLLEYADPRDAIAKIHSRNKERLDKFSRSTQIVHPSGGMQMTTVYSFRGLLEICRCSNQPKANAVMDFLYDIADEIRRTGSYSIFKDNPALPSGVIEGARIIFESAGIKGNQCALALDRVYRSYTGRSALDTGNITLTAPTNNQLLTPTDIGRRFGLKAKRVNQILAGAGFQHKVNDTWEAIGRGNDYAVMVDVGKKHGNGTAVRQLKWDSSILDVFDELRKED